MVSSNLLQCKDTIIPHNQVPMVSLTPPSKYKVYWDWSWDELVAYELPALVQHVYYQTGELKLHYVVHSLDPQNSSRNRGFAFIEYYNHACAENARQKMSNAEFKLDSNAPTVSWADSKNADSASTSQVKAVYVKNLSKDISQDKLRKLFKHHGEIQKVVLPTTKSGKDQNRIGFVHFAERSSSAMKALKNTEKYERDGHVLECTLAKPQSDRASDSGSNLQNQALLPSYPPRGYVYGAAGFPQIFRTVIL